MPTRTGSVPVVLAADIDYLPQTDVLLHQLDQYAAGAAGVVLLVAPDVGDADIASLRERNAARALPLQVRRLDGLDELRRSGGIARRGHVSAFTYSKLLLAEALSDLDQILYLDVDILIRGDLSGLLNWDLNHPIAAVPEFGGNGRHLHGSTRVAYFNAGVLRMSLARLRDEGLWQRSQAVLRDHPRLPFQDQDILNICYWDRFDALPLAYNVFDSVARDHPMLQVLQDPVIVHFTGQEKPWLDTTDSRFAREWRYRAAQCRGLDPDAYRDYVAGSAPTTAATVVARMRYSKVGRWARRSIPLRLKQFLHHPILVLAAARPGGRNKGREGGPKGQMRAAVPAVNSRRAGDGFRRRPQPRRRVSAATVWRARIRRAELRWRTRRRRWATAARKRRIRLASAITAVHRAPMFGRALTAVPPTLRRPLQDLLWSWALRPPPHIARARAAVRPVGASAGESSGQPPRGDVEQRGAPGISAPPIPDEAVAAERSVVVVSSGVSDEAVIDLRDTRPEVSAVVSPPAAGTDPVNAEAGERLSRHDDRPPQTGGTRRESERLDAVAVDRFRTYAGGRPRARGRLWVVASIPRSGTNALGTLIETGFPHVTWAGEFYLGWMPDHVRTHLQRSFPWLEQFPPRGQVREKGSARRHELKQLRDFVSNDAIGLTDSLLDLTDGPTVVKYFPGHLRHDALAAVIARYRPTLVVLRRTNLFSYVSWLKAMNSGTWFNSDSTDVDVELLAADAATYVAKADGFHEQVAKLATMVDLPVHHLTYEGLFEKRTEFAALRRAFHGQAQTRRGRSDENWLPTTTLQDRRSDSASAEVFAAFAALEPDLRHDLLRLPGDTVWSQWGNAGSQADSGSAQVRGDSISV